VAAGIRSVMGKAPTSRQLHDAFRGVRVSAADLAQASLVMRGESALLLEAPEGLVSAAHARRFRWSAGEGLRRFELSTEDGAPVHEMKVDGNEILLPEALVLEAGKKYVWGIAPPSPAAGPVDWTEFVIGGESVPAPALQGSSASEWRLYGLWLKAKGMPRAAARAAMRAAILR